MNGQVKVNFANSIATPAPIFSDTQSASIRNLIIATAYSTFKVS